MITDMLVPTDSAAFIKVRIFKHLFPSSIRIIILEDFMDFMVTVSSILQMLHVSNIQYMMIYLFCYNTYRNTG